MPPPLSRNPTISVVVAVAVVVVIVQGIRHKFHDIFNNSPRIQKVEKKQEDALPPIG